jgi:HlyD family secretion protein
MAQSDTQIQESIQSPALPKLGRKLNPRLLIPIGLLLIGSGLAAWYFFFRPTSLSEIGELEVSGRIEGYETDVGAKVAGRVDFVAVREGDLVRQGQVIARLDDAETQAQLQGATARVASAQQQEYQARLQVDVLESQIQEAQLNLQQSQGDAKGRIFQSESTVASAEAQLNEAAAQVKQARAELKLARVNRDRNAQLVRQGAISRQQFDQAQTNFETAQATVNTRESAVNAARKQVSAAQGELVQAQTTSLNPDIRSAQLNRLSKQLAQARSQLAAAQDEVKNAQAARQEIQARIGYLNINSPIDGVVITRNAEPGEVVASGNTLLTLINLNTVYLRGFIPEGDIGKVRVGQPAKVFLDSAPDKPLSAEVTAIDPEASFTPENIYFKEDRVTQVFGIKLKIKDPAGFAKPGMPADGEILTGEGEV